MAILGLGSDIVEIERIAGVIERTGNRLARRVLSASEWQQYQMHQKPVRFLATRFAVKEAAAKAFGTGIRGGLAFKQFAVYNNALGKPILHFFEQAEIFARKLGVKRVHVTLTDERRHAYAMVIIED